MQRNSNVHFMHPKPKSPGLIDCLNIKGTIITTDAMGCQRDRKEDPRETGRLCTVVKGKPGEAAGGCEAVFSDREWIQKSAYKKTTEKARGKIEKREYWQTDDMSWLSQKKSGRD